MTQEMTTDTTQIPAGNADSVEEVIEAAIAVIAARQRFSAALETALTGRDGTAEETGDALAADLRAHGLNDDELSDFADTLHRHLVATSAPAPTAQPATPDPEIVDGVDLWHTDSEWTAMGYQLVHIAQHRKIWRMDRPGQGPRMLVTKRWPPRAPHAAHASKAD